MSQLADFNAELVTIIEAVWPEVGTIYRAHQAVKGNWANIADQLRIYQNSQRPPWAVVDIDAGAPTDGKMSADSWGRIYTVGIWYVADLYTTDTTPALDSLAPIETQLEAMAKALEDKATNGTSTSYQLYPGESPGIDTARKNEVNTEMLATQMAILGGVVTFKAVIGRVAGT